MNEKMIFWKIIPLLLTFRLSLGQDESEPSSDPGKHRLDAKVGRSLVISRRFRLGWLGYSASTKLELF